ncbi:MAG: pyrroloquinoline quinone biosynthesis peptide chaperone PqqD [Gammaproteobacteria bacterium]
MNAAEQDARVPVLKRMYRFQWEPAQDCHVLLYPEGMVKLSASAGEILKRVDGQRSIAAIIEELKALFGDAPLDDDVRRFFAQAEGNGWITY